MTATIEQVIEGISDWRGKAVTAEPISGGLTNTNYRVEVNGTPYVVRIPGPSTELLAVNRENEYYNTKAAAGWTRASAGIRPCGWAVTR